VTLTDAGAPYVSACRQIIDQVEEAERTASGEYQTPRGELTFAAPLASAGSIWFRCGGVRGGIPPDPTELPLGRPRGGFSRSNSTWRSASVTYTSRPKEILVSRTAVGWYPIDFARSRHTNPARMPVSPLGCRY
jgi:hypothetical protein